MDAKAASIFISHEGEANERRTENLYCAAEMVGNLFQRIYPRGSRLMSQAVSSRKAGREA